MRLPSSVNSGLVTVRKHEAPQKMNYFNLILDNMENVTIRFYMFWEFWFVCFLCATSLQQFENIKQEVEGTVNDSIDNLRLLSNLLRYLCENYKLQCS